MTARYYAVLLRCDHSMTLLPTTTELTYFYEAAKAANFSHAAKNLNISQPTLSMAIKKLEHSLKVTLFYRQKQGLLLTRAGQQLYDHVNALLAQWDKIYAQMTSAHEDVKGRVVIGCNSAYVPFIAEGISQLLIKYPALNIQIVDGFTQNIMEGILNSSIDIGLAINPNQHANLVMITTSKPEMTFWIKKGSTPSTNIFNEDVVIICDPSIPQTSQLLDQLPATREVRTIHVNSQESIAHLVLKGDGIGILPECFVRTFYSDKFEKINGAPSCSNHSCLIYRSEDKEVAAISATVNSIKEIVSNYQLCDSIISLPREIREIRVSDKDT